MTYLYELALKPSLAGQRQEFRLEVVLGETPALIEKLKDNALDLVIATQKTSLPRLHYLPLQREHFVLVLPKSLAFPLNDPGDLTQMEVWLNQQAWISYSAQLPIIRRYWQTVFGKRPDFEPQIIIPDLHAILRGIELGLGVSILPDYMLRSDAVSRHVHTPWQPSVEVSNELYVVCQQDRLREPLIARAISAFKNGFR